MKKNLLKCLLFTLLFSFSAIPSYAQGILIPVNNKQNTADVSFKGILIPRTKESDTTSASFKGILIPRESESVTNNHTTTTHNGNITTDQIVNTHNGQTTTEHTTDTHSEQFNKNYTTDNYAGQVTTDENRAKYTEIVRYFSTLRIPGVMYHKITSNPSEWSVYSISPEMLREDFKVIKELGYTPITLSEYAEIIYAYNCIRNNSGDIDSIYELIQKHNKPILITADDGYLGIYTDFLPLLKEYNFKANFMIFGEVIDQKHPEYVTWEQITEMQKSGLVEFGNHTYSLHNYSKEELTAKYILDPNFCRQDIELNRQKLEAATGVPCNTFAYPYGARNTASNYIIDSCGYTKILNTDYRTNVLNSGIYNVARVNRDNLTPSFDFFSGLSKLRMN